MNIRFERCHHLRVVLSHLLIAPSFGARDLCHPLQLGALNFNRVLENPRLDFWNAVAEFRIGADAHQGEVAEKMKVATRGMYSRWIPDRILRIAMFDGIAKLKFEATLR